MKNFFSNLNAKTQQWMYGRYGYDELSRTLTIAAMVGLFLSWIPGLQFLYIFALILCIWSLFRCYSRNLEKRQAERMAYLRLSGKIKGWFSLRKRMWHDRKTHRYFRCKGCGTVLRVPKGKGKIEVSCAKCHNTFITKT